MASPAASSVLLMLLVAFTAGANAYNFSIVNNCSDTVWPASFPASPAGSGIQLNPGETGTLTNGYGTVKIWGRTGCSFSGGRGSCLTGDCAGAFSCSVSGQRPVTLAVFTAGGAMDNYYISVIDGFNVRMAFLCGDSGPRCDADKCPEAYPYDTKNHTCPGNSNYRVIFCP